MENLHRSTATVIPGGTGRPSPYGDSFDFVDLNWMMGDAAA
jgi:hypothetical protein